MWITLYIFITFFPGLHSTYKYCDRHGIPYRRCGKLVVATDQTEVERLEQLFERATQNGVSFGLVWFYYRFM